MFINLNTLPISSGNTLANCNIYPLTTATSGWSIDNFGRLVNQYEPLTNELIIFHTNNNNYQFSFATSGSHPNASGQSLVVSPSFDNISDKVAFTVSYGQSGYLITEQLNGSIVTLTSGRFASQPWNFINQFWQADISIAQSGNNNYTFKINNFELNYTTTSKHRTIDNNRYYKSNAFNGLIYLQFTDGSGNSMYLQNMQFKKYRPDNYIGYNLINTNNGIKKDGGTYHGPGVAIVTGEDRAVTIGRNNQRTYNANGSYFRGTVGNDTSGEDLDFIGKQNSGPQTMLEGRAILSNTKLISNNKIVSYKSGKVLNKRPSSSNFNVVTSSGQNINQFTFNNGSRRPS